MIGPLDASACKIKDTAKPINLVQFVLVSGTNEFYLKLCPHGLHLCVLYVHVYIYMYEFLMQLFTLPTYHV